MPQYQGIWTLAQAAQLQSTQRWATDPLFENTTLLLQADNAANGAQNNTFIDSSSNNFTITRNGNATQGTFTPFSQSPGWWSNYFPGGNGKYIYAPYNAAFDFGTGDFSIECFTYVTDAGRRFDANKYGTFVSGGNPLSLSGLWGFAFLISGGVINQLTFDSAGSTVLTASSQSISLNAWHHFVACRTGTTLSIYVDGIRAATTTYSSAVNTNNSGAVFVSQSAYQDVFENWLIGNMSSVRIIKGTQPYNAANASITVPITPLTAITNTSLLTCQSNRFIDSSTNAFAITIIGTGMSVQAFSPFAPQYQWTAPVIGGSMYSDGNGDYLTGSGSLSTSTSMNTFTIEGWIYPTSLNTYWIVGDMDATWVTNVLSVRIGGNGDLVLYWYDGASKECYSPNGSIRANQWNWFAIVVNNNAISMYVNSTTAASLTGTTTLTNRTQTANFSVSQYNNSITFLGYIGSLRWSNGIARTISSIPTAPYTADANTRLLLNFTNAGIYDGTMKNNLETVGNAQVSTSVVKYGTGSMAFDGTGDYLVTPSSPVNILGSGDFTIEFWAYPSNTSAAYRALVASENYAGTTGGWSIYQNGTSIEVWLTAGQVINATSALTAATWQHVALSRASGTVRLFVNGTSIASASNTAAWTGQRIFIGDNNYAGPDYFYNGYLDDLRITNGIARYTANFTPPTVALPRQ